MIALAARFATGSRCIAYLHGTKLRGHGVGIAKSIRTLPSKAKVFMKLVLYAILS
jgi:hypothetical protein